jgi:hypothetical protein
MSSLKNRKLYQLNRACFTRWRKNIIDVVLYNNYFLTALLTTSFTSCAFFTNHARMELPDASSTEVCIGIGRGFCGGGSINMLCDYIILL